MDFLFSQGHESGKIKQITTYAVVITTHTSRLINMHAEFLSKSLVQLLIKLKNSK